MHGSIRKMHLSSKIKQTIFPVSCLIIIIVEWILELKIKWLQLDWFVWHNRSVLLEYFPRDKNTSISPHSIFAYRTSRLVTSIEQFDFEYTFHWRFQNEYSNSLECFFFVSFCLWDHCMNEKFAYGNNGLIQCHPPHIHYDGMCNNVAVKNSVKIDYYIGQC